MKRLLFILALTMLPGAVLAGPAGVTVFCPNVDYYADEGYADACGASLTGPAAGANLTSTSVDGEVTTDKTGGTVYGCVSTQASRTTDEIVAGTGCASTSSTAGIAGLIELNFSGLTASTQYYAHYVHNYPVGRPVYDTERSDAFTTPAGGGGGGEDLTGEVFVVDATGAGCGGGGCSDSNNGLTVATAWASLAEVNSSVTALGSDVCLMAGSTFSYSPGSVLLDMDWGGESADPGEVFSCYVGGGGELYKWDEGDDASNPANRAGFLVSGFDCENEVVNYDADYMTLAHVDIDGSSHTCNSSQQYDFVRAANSSVNNATLEDVDIDGWPTRQAAWDAYRDQKINLVNFERGTNFTVRDSRLRYAYRGLKMSSSAASRLLFQNNEVVDMVWDCWFIGGTNASERDVFVLIEGNDFSQCHSLSSDVIQLNANSGSIRGSIRNVVIANNELGGDLGENSIDMKGGNRVDIVGNIIEGAAGDNDGPCTGSFGSFNEECDLVASTYKDTNAGDTINFGGGATETQTREILIRRNLIYDTRNGPSMQLDFHALHNTILGANKTFDGSNQTLNANNQHRTGVGINAWDGNNGGSTRNLTVLNNILGYSNTSNIAVSNGMQMRIDGNMFMLDRSENPQYTYGYKSSSTPSAFQQTTTLATWITELEGYSNLTDMDGGEPCGNCSEETINFVSDLLDPSGDYASTGMDLNPDTGSPAIGAAQPVSRANGAGSGTSIVVDDASHFRGHMGSASDVSYWEGDYIIIGATAVVQVTNVDFDTNTLTLAASRTWSDNDAIFWSTSGGTAYNDVGACDAQISGADDVCDNF